MFTVDEAIPPVTLRKATGGETRQGEELEHRLLPEPLVLPPGLRWDLATRTLSGTPTEKFEQRTYTWTATDMDGPRQRAELTFTIEVQDNLAKFRARLKALNESILPALARAQWSSALEAVTGRLGSPGGDVLAEATAALKAHEDAQDADEGLSWRKVVAGRTFALGLDEGDGGGGDGGGGSGGGSGGGGVTVWAGGDLRSLSLEKGALRWSGELFAAHVGADAALGGGFTGGVAASRFESAIDYTDSSAGAAVAGRHESRMTAVQPYIGRSWPDGSRLWAAAGYGSGEIEIADAEIMERFGAQSGEAAFLAAGVGGAVRVVSGDALTLDLKGSGEATRYSVSDNGLAIAGLAVETHRLRLSAEGSRSYSLAGGGSLAPALELGMRLDGGAGETGAGVELGGGLAWRDPASGLEVEARARGLVARAAALSEWGAGGALRLDTGGTGRGLVLRLEPSWGAAASGTARLWDDGMARAAPAKAPVARLETELGYGFGALAGAGVLTPYVGAGFEEDSRRWRAGARVGVAPALDLGLEAGRHESPTATDHSLKLDLRLKW